MGGKEDVVNGSYLGWCRRREVFYTSFVVEKEIAILWSIVYGAYWMVWVADSCEIQ